MCTGDSLCPRIFSPDLWNGIQIWKQTLGASTLEDTVRITVTMVGLWLKPSVYNQMYQLEPKKSTFDIPSQTISHLIQEEAIMSPCCRADVGVSSVIAIQSLTHPVLFLCMCESTLVCASLVLATLVGLLRKAHTREP